MSAEMGPVYFWNALDMDYQQAKYDACYIFFHVIVSSGGLVAMAAVLLSEGEKTFIVHGVKV